MKRITAIGFVALSLAFAPVTHAQYTADFQTNIISGVTSNWTGIDYRVGDTNSADVLLIQNSGVLSNGVGIVGRQIGASNNVAIITENGSVWRGGVLYVGHSGSDNSLIISNGGQVVSAISGPAITGYIGRSSGARRNKVIVTGVGSVWTNSTSSLDIPWAAVFIGYGGTDHSMTIADGGQVFSSGAVVGLGTSSNNSVAVTGSDSVWDNAGTLDVGHFANANSLVISNGGKVICESYGPFSASGCAVYGGTNNTATVLGSGVLQCNGTLSLGGCAVSTPSTMYDNGLSNRLIAAGGTILASNLTICCGNFVQLDSGSIILTNTSMTAALNVRGTFIFNDGTLQVDQLIMTDACGRFIRTGGTLIYGTAVLTTNLDADGDGMANGWEQASGLDPLNAADASADNDGDGFTNLQEFQAGTEPTNASSVFRVLSLESTNNNILVTWLAGGGRTNVVQSAPDLTGTYSNVSLNIILPGSGDVTTNFLDTGGATNGANRYYRIRLVP